MRNWLRSLWQAERAPEPLAEPLPPKWATELVEAVQKQGRASVKQGARLEAALAEHETQISALADAVETLGRSEAEDDLRAAALLHGPLFDALDGLDEAKRIAGDPHLAAGLSRIADRVQVFCERAGFARVRCEGEPPDTRLLRVVGTETRHDLPDGYVSRVVRSAIVHGDKMVREGEVIVSAPQRTQGGDDEHMGH